VTSTTRDTAATKEQGPAPIMIELISAEAKADVMKKKVNLSKHDETR
jgi:hypothetical protein